jgi:hypothetical protein
MRVMQMRRLLFLLLVLAAAITAVGSGPAAGAEISYPVRVDLSSALKFEEYLATGSGRHIGEIFKKIEETSPSEGFLASARVIDAPLTLVVYGSMTCPDCAVAVPYVEAIGRANPGISIRYFPRTAEAVELMRSVAGMYRTPTIFAARPDGVLMREFYLEFPESVRRLTDGAKDDDERRAVIREFRAGKYAADLERDLVGVLRSAELEYGSGR